MKNRHIAAFLGCLAGVYAHGASAAIISVDLDPGTAGIQSALTVAPSDVFTVDIVISDVANLNGFELDLDFDPAVLTANSVVSGGFLIAPVFGAQNFVAASEIGLAEVALLPPGASGTGILASVNFTADAAGVSLMALNDVILSALGGFPILPVTLNNATVTVGAPQGPTGIPEPSTSLLFGAGLIAIALMRRRRRA